MPGVNLPEGFNAEEHKQKARKFANAIPTRENCDIDDPQQMYLWGFVGLPGMNGGALGFPSSVLMLWSEHFYELFGPVKCEACGHVKEPDKQYVPPSAQDAHWMTSPGRWKKGHVPPRRSSLDEVLDNMPNQVKAALFERLKRQHEEGSLDA